MRTDRAGLLPAYTLIRSRRRSLGIEIRDGELLVRAPMRASVREIEAFLLLKRDWILSHLSRAEQEQRAAETAGILTEEERKNLIREAKMRIPERVAYYADLAGVTYGRISIRCQKARWGSCSSKGNLNFNCLLMLTPPEVIDSVVVHELCHRKEMNHSRRFYEEVLRLYPDYRKWNAWLRKNGGVILKRVER